MLILRVLLGYRIALLVKALALPSHHSSMSTTEARERRSLPLTRADRAIIPPTNHNWTSVNDPSDVGLLCFVQDPNIPRLVPIRDVNHCYAAVTNIIFEPSALIPELWSGTPGSRGLPYHWTYESCTVSINVDRPGAADVFPAALAAHTAAAIINFCIVGLGDLLGGTAKVGPLQWMDLVVSYPYMQGASGGISSNGTGRI